jgi:4'-phosphopantetheinyl transferase
MRTPPTHERVQLWHIDVERLDPGFLRARGLALLSESERSAYEAFRFERHRHLYLASHVLTRIALGERCGIAPEAVRFEKGRWGKPRMALSGGPEFNLSHTKGMAMVAVGSSLPIGVDVETRDQRPERSMVAIARRFFAASECERIEAMPPDEAEVAALELWTLKEALMKAVGMGFHLSPRAFEIEVNPDVPARLKSISLAGESPGDWVFVRLPMQAHQASLAIRRTEMEGIQIEARTLTSGDLSPTAARSLAIGSVGLCSPFEG